MNAKIFKTISLAVLVLLAGFNVYKVQTAVKLSDTQMKNVEALATSEKPPFENWGGHYLHVKRPGCAICEEKPDSWRNIHEQLPCY